MGAALAAAGAVKPGRKHSKVEPASRKPSAGTRAAKLASSSSTRNVQRGSVTFKDPSQANGGGSDSTPRPQSLLQKQGSTNSPSVLRRSLSEMMLGGQTDEDGSAVEVGDEEAEHK